jgi:hypothetical protein
VRVQGDGRGVLTEAGTRPMPHRHAVRRACPFCGANVEVRSNDAKFGARAYSFDHAGPLCERWRATQSLDETASIEEDRRIVVRFCSQLTQDVDEREGILWGPGGWR